MDFDELKKQIANLTEELKSRCSPETSVLVESLSFMLNMMLKMQQASLSEQLENQTRQNERLSEQLKNLTKQLEAQIKLNERLVATIEDLQLTIKDLKRQLGQNSKNSSKPPSKDDFNKPSRNKSLREKTGKKTGGQKGHKGISMSIPHDADEVKKHIPNKCKFCPNLSNCISLGNVFACGESRYVVEAVVNTHVIEHQSLKAVACPLGDIKLRGEFPEDVKAHVQYGKSFTVLASILNTTGAVSISRIQELLGDLFGVSISQGTIISMVETCAQKVSPIIKVIKQHLISSEVVNFDETGVRALGSLYWVHNASNSEFTYQSIDKKRGLEGIKTNEVSVVFKGIAVHDCWASYWNLENIKEHAVCCVHLLRELNGVIENEKVQSWASRFKQLLITMKQIKDVAIKRGKYSIEKHTLERIDKEYDSIMSLANIEFPPPQANIKQRRGRIRKGKTRALIERLIKFKKAICLFLRKFDVPYDNNQAKRDIRNVKTKIKVSVCFRSKEEAQNYLTIMSFISTAKKHGIKAFEALNAAFNGNAGAILVNGSE